MKRIIAFVLLGLLIYAGGFVIFYSCRDMLVNSAVPADMRNISANALSDGMIVKGSIYQVIGKEVDSETYGETFFSKGTKQHFYALPYENSGQYVLLGVSDEKDLEIIEQLKTEKPRERADGAPELDIFGVVGNMQPAQKSALTQFLVARPELLGIKDFLEQYIIGGRIETLAQNHIAPYVIYIKHRGDMNYIPLIAGIAMCAAGIALIILLVKRIKDEKESY